MHQRTKRKSGHPYCCAHGRRHDHEGAQGAPQRQEEGEEREAHWQRHP